jgi:hypothetical protein
VPVVPPPVVVQPVIVPPIPVSHWSVCVDALWLERNVGSSVPLGYTYLNLPATPPVPIDALQSDDVLFPLETGVRLQISRQINDHAAVEAAYWGLQQWSVGRVLYADPVGQTILADSPWLQLPGLLPLGDMDNFLGYSYASTVDSAEINGRFALGCPGPYGGLHWLAGLRYFFLSEHFILSGADSSGAYENLDYRTKNNLVGVQGGLQWTRGWDRFQMSAEAKLGLLPNFYTQQGSDTGGGSGLPGGFVPLAGSHSGTDLSVLGELSLLARFRMTSLLWLRAGYQFYCLSGLALGPRQLNNYNHNGTVELDGLSLGVEAAW